MDKFLLANGVSLPPIGFGTWSLEDGEGTVNTVLKALETGYRHIDTASAYNNEKSVGIAIRESGIPRNEIFLTTKLWTTVKTYDDTLKAFDNSLKNLNTEYIDLYLLHYPKEHSRENWRALEKLYDEGLIKSIGVSNFMLEHLRDFLPGCNIKPHVNQVEFHPHLVQPDLLGYCKKENILVEAWSPLMLGKAVTISILQELGQKYGKTPAQIVLRWDIQQNVSTIPRTEKESRMKENIDIFDFEISREDMQKISALDVGKRYGPDPYDNKF
ncbi:MAG: aldo/keto reductase [Zhaonellaceae bacterium]|jgi:diketogulonate reductase-like aldo/keto reductase